MKNLVKNENDLLTPYSEALCVVGPALVESIIGPLMGSSLAALPLPLSLLLSLLLPGTASNTWNLSPASAHEFTFPLPSRGGTELLLLPFEDPFKLSAGSTPPRVADVSLLPTLLFSRLSLPLKPPPLLLLPLPLFDGTASNTGNWLSPSTGQSPFLSC